MQDIILVHGMWMTGACWETFATVLREAGHRVHAVTLPLHRPGQTEPPEGLQGLGLGNYVDAVCDVIDELNLMHPPVLVGHSMGALIAQQVASRRKVRALALLAPVLPRQAQRLDLKRMVITWKLLRRKGWRPAPHRPRAKDLTRWMAPDLAEADAVRLAPELCWESGRVVFEMECWPLDLRGGNRVSRRDIQAPVWIAGGGRDQMIDAASVRRLAAWYQAPCTILPETGHWLLGDTAGLLVGDFLAWLAAQKTGPL